MLNGDCQFPCSYQQTFSSSNPTFAQSSSLAISQEVLITTCVLVVIIVLIVIVTWYKKWFKKDTNTQLPPKILWSFLDAQKEITKKQGGFFIKASVKLWTVTRNKKSGTFCAYIKT